MINEFWDEIPTFWANEMLSLVEVGGDGEQVSSNNTRNILLQNK